MSYTHKILSSKIFRDALEGMTPEEREQSIKYATDLGNRMEESFNLLEKFMKTPEGIDAVNKGFAKLMRPQDSE